MEIGMFLKQFIQRGIQNLRLTKSKAIPAPVGGWNVRDSLADMPETDAVALDNYFPDSTKVTQRQGYSSHATGMTGDVKSLMVYSKATGAQELYAANGANIFNVTAAGAIGAAVDTGYTVDAWQWLNMGTSGGQFLLGFNGADTPFVYNGTTWGDTTITGPTVANLIWGQSHQSRLWVGEKNTLVPWYGGTNSIGGAFTAFPLYSIAKLGGYLMGMVTWTRDGGSGADDVAVFVTSEGEAIVYSGTDPASLGEWALIGVFRIGKPIGRHFYEKAGGDVILITEDGFVPLATILGVDRAQADKTAISAKIDPVVNEAVRLYRANYGWQATLYPVGTMLIFNIPVSATQSHQYVFNTLTQAACRFTGMNAVCWAVANDKIYFGGHDGVVYQADTGLSDNGSDIRGDIFPAFSYFGAPSMVKSFALAEPVLEGDVQIKPSKYLNLDFKRPISAISPTAIVQSAAGIWDTGLWDSAVWGGD